MALPYLFLTPLLKDLCYFNSVTGEERSAAVRCVRWCNGVVLHIVLDSGLQVSLGSMARCTGGVLSSLFSRGKHKRDSSQKSLNSKLDPCLCCSKNRLATELQKKWKTVVTEATTGMLYPWYKNYRSLSIHNMISLHSLFFYFSCSFLSGFLSRMGGFASKSLLELCILLHLSLKTHLFLDIHKAPSSSQADCWVVPFTGYIANKKTPQKPSTA